MQNYGPLPWVEDLIRKYPGVDFSGLDRANIDYSNDMVTITFPSKFHADSALENCGYALRKNWNNTTFAIRFNQWNPPACAERQHDILKNYDPLHVAEECRVCTPGYGCRHAEISNALA